MTTKSQAEKAYLARYTPNAFDQVLFSVDPVIFTVEDDQLKVLLVQRDQLPQAGRWGLPGGRVDKRKAATLEESVSLKLEQKTGLHQAYFEQVCTEGGADMDPRGWSVTTVYMALVRPQPLAMENARWVPVEELDGLGPLAFWHRQLIERALERLRNKVVYTDLPIYLAPEPFTLRQLRVIYQVILGQELSRNSFNKRMVEAGILEEAGLETGVSNRPAMRYRYNGAGKPHEFKRLLGG